MAIYQQQISQWLRNSDTSQKSQSCPVSSASWNGIIRTAILLAAAFRQTTTYRRPRRKGTSMTGYGCCLLSIVLVTSSFGIAQSECPEGFRFAGNLSGSGSASSAFDQIVRTRFPRGATLDTSYQQTEVQATKGGSGVNSRLRPQDIPKGIFISPSGKSDDVYHQRWAVSDPKLEALERDGNGKTTRYGFGMRLFCKVGESGANPHFGACQVDVEVCYKPVK